MGIPEFKAVWLPLESAFYRVALYILEDAEDAADAVQDLYIRLWIARDRLDGVKQPKAYGLAMLRNLCLDRLRHAKVARSEPLNAVEFRIADDDSVLAARESIRAVEKAIARLPDNQQKVLRMRVFENMEYEDIASATGFSEGSLRVMLSAARKTLRKLLENEGY
ncbi:MAG: sigma-70 family RNA polymerase sigma factor [Bacteroidales bacterium]|nr:sigma-70 family RNA polymerase sigma factor [Bacteroidales bacterium]MBO7478868.1 sigma-70 family RNA polymerase sigma factor [Bacteroidales bacterium]MBO7487291.1 sigma-70 family RNA polymerase sigma factor [Bacteroidales bacterium]